jgi:hypothetical protein
VIAGAADVLHEAQHREQVADMHITATADSSTPAADAARLVGWTAYADGSPAAAVGGRGVSTPPEQILSRARGAAAAAQLSATRQVQVSGKAVRLPARVTNLRGWDSGADPPAPAGR